MKIKTKIKAGMVVTALLFLLFSCDNDSPLPNANIPMASANLQIDLNHEGRELLEPLAFRIYTEPQFYNEHLGHCGLLIVHGLSSDQPYSVYDLICPYDYPEKVAIRIIKDNSLRSAECPKCHTIYDLSMGIGNPTSGVGQSPLLQYQISKSGQMLYIHN
ncbi:hypothetical protein QYZ87_03275 [Porphyromonadaceae bacterium W3.11]|nr:hypothetical protein [Porphyromonadaceae bacterium W3.11]